MTRHALGVVLALAISAHGCAPRVARSVTHRTVVVVRISDFKFTPTEIVVASRDSVVWVNDDAFTHTSTSDNGTWSSPEFARGGRFALVAPAPGRYPYHCAAHPNMKGVLAVRLEE